MTLVRKIGLGAAALGTAAAVGFVMQGGTGGDAPTRPLQAATPVAESTLSFSTMGDLAPELDLKDITLTSAMDKETGGRTAPPALPMPVEASASAPANAAMAGETVVARPDCPVTLDATARAAAMVHVVLDAPCQAGDRATLHHEGMAFDVTLDATGHLEVDIPALAEDAVIIAALPNGEGAIGSTTVTSLDFYDRAVLQWHDQSGLQMHALEFGADYDTDGHVWSGHARLADVAARGDGGFMVVLGDPALPEANLAQVYTFPSGTTRATGDIALSIEAEVTELNCNATLRATTLQVTRGAAVAKQQFEVPMPECDAIGDFLVLKNPVNDLKIASN